MIVHVSSADGSQVSPRFALHCFLQVHKEVLHCLAVKPIELSASSFPCDEDHVKNAVSFRHINEPYTTPVCPWTVRLGDAKSITNQSGVISPLCECTALSTLQFGLCRLIICEKCLLCFLLA